MVFSVREMCRFGIENARDERKTYDISAPGDNKTVSLALGLQRFLRPSNEIGDYIILLMMGICSFGREIILRGIEKQFFLQKGGLTCGYFTDEWRYYVRN